jgi:multiple sugar transport system permease protein
VTRRSLPVALPHTPGDRLILVAVVVLAVLMTAPLLWAVGLSFKSNAELLIDTGSVLHGPYTLRNYGDILLTSSVLRWTLNSVVVSLGMTVGVLVFSSLAGYGFARLRFPGRDALFVLVLCTLAVPEQAVILARHRLFSQLGLHNTYPGLILPGMAVPFGVFLMTQYFRAIPSDLDEAAVMDNASSFRLLWRVLLPMTWPAQATLGIFTFLSAWNDYWWPLISGTDYRMYTLTVGIAATQINFADTAGLGFLMAQAVVASAPILIVYMFFQKYIVRVVADVTVT